MAAIVIVHGAFGGGWEWREVAGLLRARGHEVFTPTLTGFGERVHLTTTDTSLETNIQDIVNVLRYEDLSEVVLACHSYGGMVATGVADRARERLSHLVYLNALVPENGQSAADLTPPEFWRRYATEILQNADGVRFIAVPPFDDDPRVARFARGRYVPVPLRLLTDPIRLGLASDDLRRTYVWCTQDQEGLSGVQDMMRPFAERARRDSRWRLRVLHTIADAHVAMPDAVADLLDQATLPG